jgi:hypothetical protein
MMKKKITNYEQAWLDHRTSSRIGTQNEKCEHGETNCGDSSHYARLLRNPSR